MVVVPRPQLMPNAKRDSTTDKRVWVWQVYVGHLHMCVCVCSVV